MIRQTCKLVTPFLFLPCILFLLPAGISAQKANPTNYTIEEANLKVKINTIYRNKEGYILAGTTNGLYKFDGTRFTRINFPNKDFSDTVTAIFQDRSNKTWVGFRNGRIAHINNNSLVYFNPEEGTPSRMITAFAEDTENRIWFSAYGEGVYYLDEGRLYLLDDSDGLSDLNVSTVCAAPGGAMLVATDQGLNICSSDKGRKKVTVIGPRNGLPDYIVTSISQFAPGKFAIGLQDNGFCILDYPTIKISVPQVAKEWQNGPVTAILPYGRETWIATGENGLFVYDHASESLSRKILKANSRNIHTLLRDLQGNIWAASMDGGLQKTTADLVRNIPLYQPEFFEKIHCILYDRDSGIWINDDDNQGLLRHSWSNNNITVRSIRLQGLPKGNTDISALYQDPQGRIWIGTMGQGLFVLDPKSGKQRPLRENNTLKNILSISGKKETVFISSLEGAVHIELDSSTPGVEAPFTFNEYDNASTGSHYIYAIYRDRKGRTWFATDGRGIFMQEANSFTFFNEEPLVKNEHIYSITEDKQGNLWFSTANSGILRYNGKQFSRFGLAQGLSDLSISAIKTDRVGNIIIIHPHGLDVLDPDSRNIFYINNNAGIENINAHDLGAVTQDIDGNILISTVDGIMIVRVPEGSVHRPTTILEMVRLFLEPVNFDSVHAFAHDENNLTFNYTGLYYTDPNQVFYQYKLEGLDTGWVVTQDRTKNFPRLEPGKYRFRIQSSLNRNFANAHEASYSFTIRQAFYKTTWFIVASFILVLALVYWYIRNREASLKNLQRLKEEKIQFQFEVLRNQVNPHFLFNSFNTLITAIEEDPKMAVEYVENLSDFFRNIVNHRDKDIISLREELKLLETYVFLQQKRYGNNLQIETVIGETIKDRSTIPPLTLQLLVENAIKHNIVSKDKPLLIRLVTREDMLLVINNRNARHSVQPGAGMGLQNIRSRYALLTNKEILIEDKEDQFIVTLPLIIT